ncbi:hypothetical protein Hanom_Chr04g00297371 [Helianthus anomalus]
MKSVSSNIKSSPLFFCFHFDFWSFTNNWYQSPRLIPWEASSKRQCAVLRVVKKGSSPCRLRG